jgi:hypothetical protein
MILSSMALPSVIVACAGFLDVGLDQVTVLGDVASTGSDAVEHFNTLGICSAQLQYAHLVRIANLLKDDVEIPEALQSRFQYGKWHLRLTNRNAPGDELPGAQHARRVVENDTSSHALAAMNGERRNARHTSVGQLASIQVEHFNRLVLGDLGEIVLKYVQLDPDPREIHYREERLLARRLADLSAVLDDHTANRRGDRVVL